MMVLLTEIKPLEEKQLCRGFNSNLEDICVFPEHHTIPSATFLLATASFLTLDYKYYQHHCLLTQRIPRRGFWNELSQIAYLIKFVFKVLWVFLTWIFFKIFIKFVTILLQFYVLALWPWSMWDLSSWTHIPFLGRWSLNHWTAKKVPIYLLNQSQPSVPGNF